MRREKAMRNLPKRPPDTGVDARPDDKGGALTAPTAEELAPFLINVTRDTWRLRGAIERSSDRGEAAPEAVSAALERLEQDLAALGVSAVDPSGEQYYPGMRYEIAQLDSGEEGELFVQRTLAPGVMLNEQVLTIPSVVLGRRKPV